MLIVKEIPLAIGLSRGASTAVTATGGAHALAAGASLGHPLQFATPFGDVSLLAIALCAISVAMLFAWDSPRAKRYAFVRSVPGPLAVVALGIAVTLGFDALAPAFAPPLGHRVSVPPLASLDALSHAISMPDFTQLVDADVWRVALTLAVVASLETLLSLEAVEQIDPQRRRASPDRELNAQGIGNMVTAVLGGLPITSVIVRSSANVQAGARTRLSAVVHGVLLASVFVLTPVLNLIPLACLAAILIQTGYKLAKPKLFVAVAREGLERLIPFVATIVGVLATDLLIGIGIGIGVSLLCAMRANLHRAVTLTHHDDHFLLCFRKDVSFLAKPMLMRFLSQIPDRATVLIDAERADFIDRDIRETLESFVSEAPRRGIAVDKLRWPDESRRGKHAMLSLSSQSAA